jgi:hypothetical protein
MSALIDALNHALDRRIALNSEFGSIINPGLSREKIMEMTRDIPCDIPEELIDLYEWHNGTDYIYDNFIPVFEFRPLEYAIEMNGICDEYYDDISLPIMDCNGDAQLAIIIREVFDTTPIYCRDMEIGIYEQCFESLTTMAQTIAVCFDEDLYYWDVESKNIGGRDYDRYCQIHKSYNPNSALLRQMYFGYK